MSKISLDGILNDETWSRIPPETDFTQRDPTEGQKATERTELRVAYDDAAIYFGIRLYDSEPKKIVRQLSRRDNYSDADYFTSDPIDRLTRDLRNEFGRSSARRHYLNDVFTDFPGKAMKVRCPHR
jgi:hypothetical protein